MPEPSAAHPWKHVIAAEKAFLDARHPEPQARPYATGIALSGGGIRSAAVSLGMLQVLAGARLLRHFDYLSTVSGGGYIGSAMALRMSQAADAARPLAAGAEAPAGPDEVFPYGKYLTAPNKEGLTYSPELEHFRHHADYLAPRGFGSLATGFFIVARSILLNLFMWITICGALMAVLMHVVSHRWLPESWAAAIPSWLTWVFFGSTVDGDRFFRLLLGIAGLLLLFLASGVAGVSLSSWWVRSDRKPGQGLQFVVTQVILIAIAGALLVLAVRDIPPPKGAVYWLTHTDAVQITLPVLMLLAIFVPLGSQLYNWVLPAVRGKVVSPKYVRRQVQERLAGLLLTLAVALAVIGAIPHISQLLVTTFGSSQPPGSQWQDRLAADGVSGISAGPDRPHIPLYLFLVYLGSGAAALLGYYNAHIKGRYGIPTAVVVIVGSIVLVFGAMLIAHQVAEVLYGLGWPGTWLWDDDTRSYLTSWPSVAAASALIVAVTLAVLVNINDMSLQRFYRDRLMEAFMPDIKANRPEPGPASEADGYHLSALAHGAEPGSKDGRRPIGPYPIINTYLIARRYRRRRRRGHPRSERDVLADRVRNRLGDSFILSPCFVGSNLTRWRKTKEVVENQLTVATAMSISGAAINPGGGLAGRGVATNYATAVAMSLLSLRLGYRLRWQQNWFMGIRRWVNPFGNHIIPGASELVCELLGIRGSSNPAFIELSDGGHFDNLGLYELVRRRCGLILVCDGGEDPSGSYEAFTSVMMMIREDFGVVVEFDRSVGGKASTPAHLVARDRPDEYPKTAEFAERGFFLATLHYPPDPAGGTQSTETAGAMEDLLNEYRETRGPATGLVVYMKSAMLTQLGLPSRGYKGAHPEFPYEPTSDQFFTPEQFTAYRDVGNQIALQMLRETRLVERLGDNPLERPDIDDLVGAFKPIRRAARRSRLKHPPQ